MNYDEYMEWIEKAEEQTLETLPDFIKEIKTHMDGSLIKTTYGRIACDKAAVSAVKKAFL